MAHAKSKTPIDLANAAAVLGRKGGRATSPAKAASSRRNAQLARTRLKKLRDAAKKPLDKLSRTA